ncbi:MAG: helix-turn-helix domain-containing protein [Sporolactobacillus sp.]
MRVILNKKSVDEEKKKRGWSNYDLAEKMDMNPVTVYRALSGERNVGNEFIAQMMKAFSASSDDFSKFFIFDEVLTKSNEGR